KPNAAAADVRAMRLDEAKAIYRVKYWDAQRCDDLPAGVDDAVFDYGVNSGIGRSGKVLRRCLGLPDNTGVINEAVIAAARRADAGRLASAICDERLRFLKSLRTWPVFGKGWGRRVAEVKAFALQQAGRQSLAPPVVERHAASIGKGVVPVAKAARQGSAGAIATGGAVAVQQAHAAGVDLVGLIAILALVLAAVVMMYVFWQWRQCQRQEAAA
ncbi:MAG: hypothetical protein B7X76_08090, partial [Azorhizobium sp. 39-67-5]